jgi:RNA 2',3'-cyclic 3'-phosphodiesterase
MRTFVAVAPDAALRDALRACQLQLATHAGRADTRLVHPDDLHLTLCFIGALAPAQSEAVIATLSDVAARTAGHEVAPVAIAGWPARAPRLVVVEFECSERLDALVSELRDALASLGLAIEERRFRPHITLARSRHPLRSGLALAAVPSAALPIRSIDLYRSDAGRAGARYTLLHRAALAG